MILFQRIIITLKNKTMEITLLAIGWFTFNCAMLFYASDALKIIIAVCLVYAELHYIEKVI